MDQFNLKQKDVYNFDDFMDLSKPSFGGPNSGIKYEANKEPKQLSKYRRVVHRYAPAENGVFNPNYDGHWAAINKDRANRDANTYSNERGKYIDDLKHGRSLPTLESFLIVFENVGDDQTDELENDSPIYADKDEHPEIEDYQNQPFPKESDEMDALSATEDFQKRGQDQFKIKYHTTVAKKKDETE